MQTHGFRSYYYKILQVFTAKTPALVQLCLHTRQWLGHATLVSEEEEGMMVGGRVDGLHKKTNEWLDRWMGRHVNDWPEGGHFEIICVHRYLHPCCCLHMCVNAGV